MIMKRFRKEGLVLPLGRACPRGLRLVMAVAGAVALVGCASFKRSGQSLPQETYEMVTTPERPGGRQEGPGPGASEAPSRQAEATTAAVEIPTPARLPPKAETPPVMAAGALPGGPAPDANLAGDAALYRIHAGDTLTIQVVGEEDLSGEFKVSSEGVILYSLLGRITVTGLSSATIEKSLTERLAKDYLVNPKVYVQVRSSITRRVIIFGEVKSPGVYELPVGERCTLLQVIAKAGGLTDLAATDRVRIVRRSSGAEKLIKVSVSDLLRGHADSQDVELQPNDVVTIPQTIF
jgi:protein involved in polysaccharide export with SLBB domain